MDPTSGNGPETTPVPLSSSESDSFGGEKRPSRETVINTFNAAFDLFNNTPDNDLNSEELAARDHLAEIKAKTLDVNKDSYVNSFTGPDGKKYTQTEHIPLEGLTAFLSKKHTEAVNEGNTETEETLRKQLEVLLEKKTGVPYVRVPRRRMADPKYIARVMAETKRIGKDPRLTSGNERADYIKAHQLLTKRWELMIPKEAKNSDFPETEDSQPNQTSPEADEIKRQEELARKFWDSKNQEQIQKIKDGWKREIDQIVDTNTEKILLKAPNNHDFDNFHAAYSRYASELGYDCTFTIDYSNGTGIMETKKRHVDPSSSTAGAGGADDENPTLSTVPSEVPPATLTPPPSVTTPIPEAIGEIPPTMVAEVMGEVPPTTIGGTEEPTIEGSSEDIPLTDAPGSSEEPEPEAEPVPTPPTIEVVIKEYSLIIGNRTEDIRKRAAELAELHLREEQRNGRLWNPRAFARKIKLRVLEEYYRQKYTKEVTQVMLDNKNSLLGYDFAAKAAINTTAEIERGKAEGQAKIEQLKTGELIEGQKVAPVEGEIRNKIIAEFIKPITDGTLTDEKELQDKLKAFVARDDIKDDPQIKELFGNESTQYGMKADFFATDLLEMGRQIKTDKEAHGFSLSEMDNYIKIQLANTSWAAETQVKWSMADKAIAWSQRNGKRGWFTNPAVVGAVTSIGLYGGMRAAGYSGKTLLAAAPGAGLLVGASFAAVRRAHDLKVDRASHQAEMAYGAKLPEQDAKRRKSLEKFTLETTSVNTLLAGGNERTTVGGDTRGMQELMGLDLTNAENRMALMRRISEVRTRLDYSSSQKIDLITYQSRETVEQGRLELIKAVAEGKKKLLDAGVTQDQMDGELRRLYGDWSAQFLTNRESQDKAFNRYRVKQSLISAGIGGASGLAIGLGAGVAIREAMDHTVGNTHISGLEKVPGLNKLTGKSDNTQEHMQALSTENKPVKIGDLSLSMDANNHIVTTTPDGVSQVHENWTIDGNGHILASGEIPRDVKDQFKLEGFDISEHTDKQPVTFDSSLPPDQDQLPGLQHQSYVPHGTGWVQNPDDSTKWNLVVNQHPDQVLIHNASVTPDGQSITYDSATSVFGENAFTNNRIVEIEAAHIESKDVFGPDGLWERNGTPIDHREWYGNNTKVSDLNELRAYNSVFTSNGQKGIDWDMSHMQPGGSFQDGNHPQSVNVQEVIGQGKAAIAFSTPDHQGNPIIITDDSDAWIDGHFRLDPTDTVHHINSDPNSMTVAEFSKLVVDQQKLASFPDGSLASELTGHQDIFTLGKDGKPGFMETGRLVEIDGKKVFQPFATAQGTGDAPETIDILIPAKTDHVIDIVPKPVVFDHTVTEIIPPSDHEIPFVPWVASPRFPLERLETAPPPPPPLPPYYSYGYGLEVLNPEQQNQVRSRYSSRLKNDPEANLDASIEIPDYFNRQSPEHMRQLEQYMQQPGMTEAMNDNCDAVVCIPVYDLGEGQAIGKTLEQYLLQIDKTKNAQAIEPEKFELLLFLNHPAGKRGKKDTELGHPYADGAEARVRAGTPEPYDTEEVIRQFQQAHPELKIRVMKREYDGDNIKPWGTIIKDHYDSALMRASRRTNPAHKDPLILTNDADLVNVSPTYMRDILQYMDQNDLVSTRDGGRRLDAIVGKIDMPNQGYEKEPGFLAAERLYQFLDAQQRRKPNRSAITQGRNTIIRGSSYAAMGGPLETYGAGADTLLGGAIRDARRGVKTIDYINKAWLYSDPRRELEKWQSNVPLAYAWNNWGDTQIYGEGWQDRFRSLSKNTGKVDIAKLQRDISAEQWRWGLELDSPELKRALAWLGLKPTDYHLGKIKDFDGSGNEIEKDGIVIDNSATLEQRLKDFQTEKRWEKAERRSEKALEASPSSSLNEKFYAEYTDYEEFDRLKADIFGVMGDGSDSEYPWRPDPSNPTPKIIDLGAHIGVSALWWKNIAPNAKITAVEANPGLYPVLERNVAKNKIQSDVTIVKGAVTSQAGNVKFFSPKLGQGWNWEGFIAKDNPNPSKYDEIEVPTVQLSTLINGPVDLLKLDIEGSEVQALKEAEPKLSQVKEIMMEFHNNPDTPENSFNEALALLQRQGYTYEIRLNNQPITDFSEFTVDDRFNLTILAKRPSPSSAPTPPMPIPVLRASAPRPVIPTPVTAMPLTAPVAPTVTAPTTATTTAAPVTTTAPATTTAPLTVPTTTPLATPPPSTTIPPALTTPAPAPATPEPADPVPDTLLGRIDTSLSTETGAQSSFELTQPDLLEYVGSLKLPQGAKINAFNTRINGDHLEVKGNVTAKGGSTSFTADIKTDTNGKIIVENQDIKPTFLHRPFAGNIRTRISNLDTELTTALNAQLSNGWRVEGFTLAGNNIKINFNKTP